MRFTGAETEIDLKTPRNDQPTRNSTPGAGSGSIALLACVVPFRREVYRTVARESRILHTPDHKWGVTIKAVLFDLGETLVDERRMWNESAEYLRIPRPVLLSALHDTIARGEHHHRAFERLGVDPAAAQQRRVADGTRYLFRRDDLYADAAPCLTTLRNAGIFVGIAGNQSRDLLDSMLALGLDADMITTSEHLGSDKPSTRFFEALLAHTGFQPKDAAYVGDRIDNDVLPARAVGMAGVFLVRGIWGTSARAVERGNAKPDNLRIPSRGARFLTCREPSHDDLQYLADKRGDGNAEVTADGVLRRRRNSDRRDAADAAMGRHAGC